MCAAGVIDQDYRGNVGVVLFNFSEADFEGMHSMLLCTGMGIKNGKVSWKVGAWGAQKAPSGGPGGNAPGGGQGVKPPEAEAF